MPLSRQIISSQSEGHSTLLNQEFAQADIAFATTGGLRDAVEAGPVTYEELFSVQPFGADLVRMEMSGDQLYRAQEQQFRSDRNRILQPSGLRYAYDTARPAGQRLTSATLPDGTALRRGATYTVVTDDFLASGGDGFSAFEEGRNARGVGEDIEAFEAHVKSLSQTFVVPEPAQERRITREG